MIFIFVPYYHEPEQEFLDCLDRQTVKFKLIKYNRKAHKDLWTHALNFFVSELKRYRGITDNDVACFMNCDITFGDTLVEEGSRVRTGEILIPEGCQVTIDWAKKKFYEGDRIDSFIGRCVFMKVNDLIKTGGFCKLLPHYLSDIEFGIRVIKQGFRVKIMNQSITHEEHDRSAPLFSLRAVNNPVLWTIFLLRAGINRYLPLNILKSWYIKNK